MGWTEPALQDTLVRAGADLESGLALPELDALDLVQRLARLFRASRRAAGSARHRRQPVVRKPEREMDE